MSDAALNHLNSLPEADAQATFARCCASTHWSREMAARRPYESLEELQLSAEHVADTLTRDDWIEAFAAHPRIGDRAVLRERLAASRAAGWEGGEQGGVDADDDELLDALEAGNHAYEQKFGYVFLICATGRSGEEMRAELERRLPADPADEWRTAAAEQRKITQLRLHKLFNELAATPARGGSR